MEHQKGGKPKNKNSCKTIKSGEEVVKKLRLKIITKTCYNVVMLNRLILLISLIAVIILMAMMNLTTPTEIGPSGVLIFFILNYLVMF